MSILKTTVLALLLSAGSHACAQAPSFEREVVVVDFDDRTEEVLKRKMNRAYLAEVTEKLFAS